MSSSNFISGVLVGALAGLTVGILLAPEKGTETRKRLREKGNDLANSVKDKFSKFAGDSEDSLDEAGNKVEDWARKGKRKGKDMLDQAENKVEEWQDKANNSF
ncbi:MAG: YtxH domain-containing protein [Chitinophagaceae bacterium]